MNEDKYMKMAIMQANQALLRKEMPVGCVIVYKNKIIGRGYNKKETLKDSTMHAEIIAIRKACKKMNDWRLNDCTLYVTMEPCIMCMGTIIESRIKKIVYGVLNEHTHNDIKSLALKEKITLEQGMYRETIEKQL